MVKRESLAVALFAAAVLILWGWMEFRPDTRLGQGTPPPVVMGRDIASGLSVLDRDWTPLESMRWVDVGPTSSGFGANGPLRQRFLEETTGATHPPMVYLRGLMLLTDNRPAEALAEFSRADLSEAPVEMLYAPWRLRSTLETDAPNPYTDRLVQAAREGTLTPLTAARVLAFTGDRSTALTRYLQTDPAGWTSFDVECFRLLRADEASAAETTGMLMAALRAGRIPAALQPPVARLIRNQPEPPAEIGPKLVRLVQENPEIRALAEKSLISLLEDRRLFLEDKHAELLARHEKTPPGEVIDETAILLVLSASALPDQPAFARWSEELRRRFPQPEVAQWLDSLMTAQP